MIFFVKMGQAESNRVDEIKEWMDTRMKEKEEELYREERRKTEKETGGYRKKCERAP